MSEYPLLHTLSFDTDVCDESCMSPDGTMILLFPGREGGFGDDEYKPLATAKKEEHFKLCDTSNWRITTIDTSLNIIKHKTDNDGWENRAVWSLDSSKIAFMNSHGQVVLFHVSTSKWTVMEDNHFTFALSTHYNPSETPRKTPHSKMIWNHEYTIVTEGTQFDYSDYRKKRKFIRLWSVKENKCIRMIEEEDSSWETNGNVYCTSKMKGDDIRLTNTINLSTGEPTVRAYHGDGGHVEGQNVVFQSKKAWTLWHLSGVSVPGRGKIVFEPPVFFHRTVRGQR